MAPEENLNVIFRTRQELRRQSHQERQHTAWNCSGRRWSPAESDSGSSVALPRLIVDLIADALLEAIDRSLQHSTFRAIAALIWLQQVAEAPPGLLLVAPDGVTKYTGVVVIERSRAVFLIALRHSPDEHQPSQTPDQHDHPNWSSARRLNLFDDDDTALGERNPLY